MSPMPAQQPIPTSVTEHEKHIDGVILSFLLADDAQRPWSEVEVAREIEDPIAAADSLKRLAEAVSFIASTASCSPPAPPRSRRKSRSRRPLERCVRMRRGAPGTPDAVSSATMRLWPI